MEVTAVVLGFADAPRVPAELPEPEAGAGFLTRWYYADERHAQYHFRSDGHPLGGRRASLCVAQMLCDRPPEAELDALNERVRRFEAGETVPHEAVPSFARAYRVVRAFASPGSGVSPSGVPLLPHDGIQIACASLQTDAIAEATRWWYEYHYPDCVTVRGWKGVLSLEPLGREGRGELTHLFVIQGDVDRTQAAMNRCVAEWRAGGRSPSPRGISRRIFSGPYSWISPRGS